METIMNFVNEFVIILKTNNIMNLLMPCLTAVIIEYLRRKLGVEKVRKNYEQFAAKRELAELAVRFVEQAYNEVHGSQKYKKAAGWLVARAKEQGLRIDLNEVEGLIESALRKIKDHYGDEWGKRKTSKDNSNE